MIGTARRIAVLAAVLLTGAGLAACSTTSKTSAPTTSSAKPVYGGTLHIVAASGPEHFDTVPSYYTADYQLTHAYTRQLLSYPSLPYTSTADPNWVKDTTPSPDVATEVPTVANGGVTNDGKTYTFNIKPGVDWNTTPARQVTSQDFLREFKAFFNPVSPVGNPVYYDEHDRRPHRVRQRGDCLLRERQGAPADGGEHRELPGHAQHLRHLHAERLTIQFTLMTPASDFLYMLAMPFTSARPVEYDSYVPNSLQLDQHTISDGPYQISSYVPGKSITMIRDPAWKQSTDSLRHAYVSKIVDTLGVTSAQTQLAEMQAGTEDVTNDTPLNPSSIPALEASHDPNFYICPGRRREPYIVFNLRSPDSSGAMSKVLVRQAVEYGLDKAAVQKAYGGPAVCLDHQHGDPAGQRRVPELPTSTRTTTARATWRCASPTWPRRVTRTA